MKRQIPILIVSLWGLIELPLFYLNDITEDYPESFIHTALQFFTVGTHLLWFTPAVWIAYLKLTVNGVLQNEGTDATPSSGPICLQSEGSPIEFRNIYLEPVDNKWLRPPAPETGESWHAALQALHSKLGTPRQ